MEFVHMVVVEDEHGLLQATRKVWRSEFFAQAYADTCAPSRRPRVVQMHANSVNPLYIQD